MIIAGVILSIMFLGYLNERISDLGEKEVKKILKSYLIPENTLEFLLKDNISNFKKIIEEEIRNFITDMIKS